MKANEKDKVSKGPVHYRKGDKVKQCGTCDMFHNNLCTLVYGFIFHDDVCDKWTKKKGK